MDRSTKPAALICPMSPNWVPERPHDGEQDAFGACRAPRNLDDVVFEPAILAPVAWLFAP